MSYSWRTYSVHVEPFGCLAGAQDELGDEPSRDTRYRHTRVSTSLDMDGFFQAYHRQPCAVLTKPCYLTT